MNEFIRLFNGIGEAKDLLDAMESIERCLDEDCLREPVRRPDVIDMVIDYLESLKDKKL